MSRRGGEMGCWSFVDAVYTCAGFDKGGREKIFPDDKDYNCGSCDKYKNSNNTLPEEKKDLIQPGYWIQFKNKEYYEIEHSAIFLCWIDKK
jgi:hypothetical protein